MWWTITRLIGALFLIVCAVIDIRQRTLPIVLLGAGAMGAIICCLVTGMDGCLYGGGIILGLFFMGISKWTKEGFGYGDSVLILILGIFVGLWNVIHILVLAFGTAGLFSIIYTIWKKAGCKSTFPFVPFLTAGYLGWWWL